MKVWDEYQKIIVTKLLIGLAFNHTNFPPSYFNVQEALARPLGRLSFDPRAPRSWNTPKAEALLRLPSPQAEPLKRKQQQKGRSSEIGFCSNFAHPTLHITEKSAANFLFHCDRPIVLNLCGIQGGIGYITLHCSGWGQQFEGRRWPRWWKRKKFSKVFEVLFHAVIVPFGPAIDKGLRYLQTHLHFAAPNKLFVCLFVCFRFCFFFWVLGFGEECRGEILLN